MILNFQLWLGLPGLDLCLGGDGGVGEFDFGRGYLG